jgi:catechol 2,3-dioxygenase-like lactoylglutathione lyase family enzyme
MNLQSSTPVVFVYVTDRERAVAFYRDTLGFTQGRANAHGDYLDMGKALIHVMAMPDHKASPHPVVGWDVPDIAATAAALKERGVAMTVYEGFGQDEMGIWTAPDGFPKLAWFADPDGNFLQLSQSA